MTATPTPPASALLPCPFCGNDNIEAKDYSGDSSSLASVWCSKCGTHGPEETHEGAAIAAWNTRATPSDARRARAVERVAQRIADKYCAPKYSDGDWAVPAIAAIITAELGAGEGRDGIPDLVGFAQAVMEQWPEGSPDTGELQEIAVKHGLLLPEKRHTFCNDGEEDDGTCACREYCDATDLRVGFTCYRRAKLPAPPITTTGERK